MRYFVVVYRLEATTKMGELLKEMFYNAYNHSLITEEQLLNLPAEVERAQNNIILRNSRIKMMKVSVHGMYEQDGAFHVMSGESGKRIQISVHGEKRGWKDNTCMRITALPVIIDYTRKKGGMK